ncbi:MAG TPA: stage II sporulation protein E, partial [Flavobacteriales bacterium]|nr:stage II sporulation protein E [Flavobacteriales bacterium]
IIALSAWMFYNRFKVSQQQKKEIERQKLLVDEKNREILDSINYAKRLQQAILPPVNDFSRLLGDAFVLYLPKDIVAGDFYFLETKEEEVLFAAADCTG